jgi:hypothetical protein
MERFVSSLAIRIGWIVIILLICKEHFNTWELNLISQWL